MYVREFLWVRQSAACNGSVPWCLDTRYSVSLGTLATCVSSNQPHVITPVIKSSGSWINIFSDPLKPSVNSDHLWHGDSSWQPSSVTFVHEAMIHSELCFVIWWHWRLRVWREWDQGSWHHQHSERESHQELGTMSSNVQRKHSFVSINIAPPEYLLCFANKR